MARALSSPLLVLLSRDFLHFISNTLFSASGILFQFLKGSLIFFLFFLSKSFCVGDAILFSVEIFEEVSFSGSLCWISFGFLSLHDGSS